MHEWCGFDRNQQKRERQPLTEFERTVRRFVEQQNIFTVSHRKQSKQTKRTHKRRPQMNPPCIRIQPGDSYPSSVSRVRVRVRGARPIPRNTDGLRSRCVIPHA